MAFVKTFALAALLVFVFVYPQHGDAEAKPIGLRFSSFGPNHIRGECRYTDSLGLRFDIRPGFMEMKTLNGNETIALYMKLPRDTNYFQIADIGFVSRQNKEALVPEEVPRTFKALKKFAAERFSTGNGLPDEDITLEEAHSQGLETIRQMEETRLLEICSKTLAEAGASGETFEITQPFHLMSLNLLQALDRAGKQVKLVRAPETHHEESSSRRSKRCTDLRSDPSNNNCYGMCGRKCTCWKWVCGNCCYHRGCAQHDYCCRKKFWSKYCLFPFSYKFKCSSYGGYSRC